MEKALDFGFSLESIQRLGVQVPPRVLFCTGFHGGDGTRRTAWTTLMRYSTQRLSDSQHERAQVPLVVTERCRLGNRVVR
jgi:hypothetical protein